MTGESLSLVFCFNCLKAASGKMRWCGCECQTPEMREMLNIIYQLHLLITLDSCCVECDLTQVPLLTIFKCFLSCICLPVLPYIELNFPPYSSLFCCVCLPILPYFELHLPPYSSLFFYAALPVFTVTRWHLCISNI